MTFKKAADGVTKTGKTNPKVYPNDGPKVIQSGPKANKSSLGSIFRLPIKSFPVSSFEFA